MEKCECRYDKEIAVVLDTYKRWKSIMDGNNGHEAIGTRLKVIEDEQKRNIKAMSDITQTTSDLRTAVSGLLKTIEFNKEQEEKKEKKKNINFSQILAIVMATLAFLAFAYDIVKNWKILSL